MILCDTNILIHAFNGNTSTIEVLEEIGFKNILLSSITTMELLQGMGNKADWHR
jgi:predicted nucleic acid-binding protein